MLSRFQFSLRGLFIAVAVAAVASQLLRMRAPFGIWVYAAIMGVIVYNAVVETIAGR